MWLVFLILIFAIGVIFSKIEINLYQFQFLEKNWQGELKILLKLFGILNIPIFMIHNQKFKMFGKKVNYQELFHKRKRYQFDRKTFQDLKNRIQLNEACFILKIGLVDMALTNVMIVILSSVFSIILKGKSKYQIFPEYDKFCIELSGKITISLKILDVWIWYWKNIRQKVAHTKIKNDRVKENFENERASY